MKKINGYTGLIKLVGLVFGLPLLIYLCGIRQTVDHYRTTQALSAQIESMQANRDVVKEKPLFEKNPEDSDAVKTGGILNRVTPLLERFEVKAESYTPYLLFRGDGAEVYAGELLLSGRFISLTGLLDELQKQLRDERIVSVTYRTAIHPKSRKKQLQTTVIFQQII